ncbi:tripartite tricarboxylate transporter TctB family protein [Shouchella shacheensis]|uniref:tripartite tricarboxylate transporter TctB family protein n=1 Tax=Shouchella shacheensis TaxID=1649580 RepID=UPI00073FF1CC|nr:tripartite tricarboxylate transporter TctB family protein [Shouchella shacheensis]
MTKRGYYFIFSGLLFALFAWAIWESLEFQPIARYYPMYIGIAAASLIVLDVSLQIQKNRKSVPAEEEEETSTVNGKSSLLYVAWIIGYLILIYTLGFVVATGLFLISFLKVEAKFNWLKSVFFTLIAIGIIFLFREFMTTYWPTGLYEVI